MNNQPSEIQNTVSLTVNSGSESNLESEINKDWECAEMCGQFPLRIPKTHKCRQCDRALHAFCGHTDPSNEYIQWCTPCFGKIKDISNIDMMRQRVDYVEERMANTVKNVPPVPLPVQQRQTVNRSNTHPSNYISTNTKETSSNSTTIPQKTPEKQPPPLIQQQSQIQSHYVPGLSGTYSLSRVSTGIPGLLHPGFKVNGTYTRNVFQNNNRSNI